MSMSWNRFQSQFRETDWERRERFRKQRAAPAIETRSAKTEGLGPEDESAMPKAGAHN